MTLKELEDELDVAIKRAESVSRLLVKVRDEVKNAPQELGLVE